MSARSADMFMKAILCRMILSVLSVNMALMILKKFNLRSKAGSVKSEPAFYTLQVTSTAMPV